MKSNLQNKKISSKNTVGTSSKIKFIVGIDEVGRGPFAGPVAVCAFIMPVGFKVSGFGPLKDSKKLKPKEREDVFNKLRSLKVHHGVLDYCVSYESAERIDRFGLTKTINNCIKKSLKNIKADPKNCLVLCVPDK